MKRLNIKLAVCVAIGLLVLGGGVHLLHAIQVDRNAEGVFEQAQTLYEKRDLKEAIQFGLRYRNLRPDDLEGSRLLADIAFDAAEEVGATRKKKLQAIAEMERALRLDPDDAKRRRKLLDYYVENGWITSAIDHVKLLRNPREPDPKLEIIAAKCYAATGAYDEAADICQMLVGYDPIKRAFSDDAPGRNDYTAYAILADLMRQGKRGSAEQADAVIEKMIELNGESSEAHLAAHSYWWRNQEIERAKEALARAYEIDPDSPEVAILTAEQAIDQERLDDAESLLQAALEKNPDKDRLYQHLAFVHQRRRQPAEAVKILQKGLEKLPESDLLLEYLVGVQLENRNVEQARVAYKKLKELGLTESAYDYYEGQFLMGEKKWTQAINRLTQARSKLIHDQRLVAQIDTLLGKCHQALGDWDNAMKFYSTIANKSTSLTDADLGMAQMLFATGRNADALKQFEAIAAASAEKTLDMQFVWRPLLRLRVWDQMQQPKEKRVWTKVEELVEQLHEAGKLDPVAYTTLQGELLVNKGEIEEARTLYSSALHADPQSEGLWFARLNLELEASGAEQALKMAQQAPREIQDGVYLRLARAAIFARMDGETAKAGLLAQERGIEQLNTDDQYRLLQGLAQHHKQRKDHESAQRLLDRMMAQWDKDLFSRNLTFDIAREKSDIKSMEKMVAEIRAIMEPASPYPPVFEAVTKITGVTASQRAKLKNKPSETKFDLSADERKSLAEARELLEKVAKDNAAWNEPHKWLADIRALENDSEGMLAELRIALREGPLDSNRTRQLYDLLVAKGHNAEAESVYAKLGGAKREGTEWSRLAILIQGKRIDEARALLDTLEPKPDTPLEDLLQYADARRRINDLDKAESALRQAVQLDSSSPHAWVLLVNTLVAAQKMTEAQAILETARERAPAEERDLILAQCYEALRDSAQAEQSYLKAIAARPNSLPANQAMASFYLRTNRNDSAMKYLDAIASLGAAATSATDKEIVDWALRGQAVALATNGNWQQFKQAEALLLANEEKIRQNGGEPDPAHLLLRSALLSNRVEPVCVRAALELLEEIQTRQPLQTSELVNMARLYERVGEWSKAKQLMLGVLAGRNPAPLHYLGYAEMLWRNGEYSDADTWLEKYDRVKNDGASMPIRIKVRVRQGREKEAVALVDRWLGQPPWRSPQQLEAVRVAATLLHQLRQYDAAERLWRGYVRSQPSAVIMLATSVGMHRDLDDAISLLEQSLKHHPPRDVLLVAMEVLRARKADARPEHFTALGRWYASARESAPKDPQLEMLVGDLWEIRGDLARAEKAYRDLLARKDLEPMIRAHVGNNLAFILSTQRKDTDEAIRLIDSAMEVYGPSSDLLDTRGVVHMAADQPEKALADFKEAVLVPSAMKWVHLALAQAALQDQQGARASLKKAQEMDLKRQDLYEAEWARYEQLARELGMQ